jgi:hypothetical protein
MSLAERDETTLQPAGAGYSVLPVLPSTPVEELYLAYVKGLSVDRISRRQASGSRQ